MYKEKAKAPSCQMLSACEVLSWQKSELLSTSQPSSSCFVVSQSAEMAGKQHRRFPVE